MPKCRCGRECDYKECDVCYWNRVTKSPPTLENEIREQRKYMEGMKTEHESAQMQGYVEDWL